MTQGRGYDEGTIARIMKLAGEGLTPRLIAERLGLRSDTRGTARVQKIIKRRREKDAKAHAKTKPLTAGTDAEQVETQHASPCGDCPWRRNALEGWLGDFTPEQWLQAAHGEVKIECHTLLGAQCAGSAIYRANVGKRPRCADILILPADKEKVFSWPDEFKKHHEKE